MAWIELPLKAIHINKCPVIAPVNTLTEEAAKRLEIDTSLHNQHLQIILNAGNLSEKIQSVFKDIEYEAITDPDQSLYSGGFFSNDDRNRMNTIRSTPANQLAKLDLNFDDKRLSEMLFRFRARNYPETLTEIEQKLWHQYRKDKLTRSNNGSSLTLDEYLNKINKLQEKNELTDQQNNLLHDLKNYGLEIKKILSTRL